VSVPLDLLAILRNGLPGASGPARHIVIVGAGIAGLTAGMLLKEAGHRVTILEARNRLGGRISTYRGFAGGMYGELGAMRFPRQHRLGQHLIHERFKLATTPFPMVDEDTLIHLDGRTVRRAEFDASSFDYHLPPSEQGKLPAQILKEAVQPLRDILAQPGGWERLIAEYDHHSVLSYLVERGVSEQARMLMGPLLDLEGRYHFSLLEWFAHYAEDVFGDLVYITDGADTLADAFGPLLLNDTRFGAIVTGIDPDADRVRIHYRNAAGGTGSVAADECIVTAPFVMLRHMEIGGLDQDKRFTLRNVYYGRAHKIFMQFSRKWWVEDYGITHGVSVSDLAIRNVVYTPAGQAPGLDRGVLIASYAWEQDSIPYGMLSEQDRISQALEDLVKLHPEAKDTFEFGVSWDWALDPFAGGIGPLFRPHEMGSSFFDDIVRPVGRLWFANDACDRRHRRWIEAALVAAVRNAWAIHAGLRNELPGIAEG